MPPRAATGRRVDRATPDGSGLPLQLPEPPPFPERLRPEEAVPCSQPFDSSDWRFSVDWDGARCLLLVAADGTTSVQAHNQRDLTHRFPEIARAGHAVLRRPAVLDGTVVILESSGRPDLHTLSLRLLLGASAGSLSPAIFLANDLLQLEGASTLAWPLDRRVRTLAEMVESGTTIQVPEHIAGRGTALAEAATARALSALLARRGAAPYRPGVASPDRLRIELLPRVTCIVLGMEPTRVSPVGRLFLGEYFDGRIAFAGHVDGPRDRRLESWLRSHAAGLRVADPLAAVPEASSRAQWLRPALAATVGYESRGGDALLEATTLIALRDDVDVAWCVRRAPQAPPGEAYRSAFVPTVLMPLPLDDTVLLPRSRG